MIPRFEPYITVRYTVNEPYFGGTIKSITIHKLDKLLTEGIEAIAEENGESLNLTIKKLLARALNIDDAPQFQKENRKGYRQFSGKWTDEEAALFAEATAEFSEIDERDRH